MNNITNFLGLQGILTDNFVENDNSIIISAHTPASTQLCPRCGKPTSFIHGYRTQKVKDLPMRLKNVTIHRRSIVNSVIYKYSNGITEGFNNKIKVLKRNAYGYRNFDNIRKRFMLNGSKYGNHACTWLP